MKNRGKNVRNPRKSLIVIYNNKNKMSNYYISYTREGVFTRIYSMTNLTNLTNPTGPRGQWRGGELGLPDKLLTNS